MDRLLDRLNEYGADIKGAMNRFIDDEELYLSCFDVFLKDESFDGLDKAIKTADYEAAFDFAHTLKGVSGNMGLTPFFEAIENLVEALRAKDYKDVQALYQEVTVQYAVLRHL